ncbi:molybdopterin-dependent oxidoreductase [Terrimonas sp. NA20]|uniref:Molybdopterin-dependent oxidoreductase n=1 Tax=Terrimonas ginsenosidimutans TaxID=2908004 RepID=A0ABS9KP30_9BACT|nr:molybdopterin-dependent oxidoreductase [Terrimonas ginsenosidimutans]MCG2614087.1 molybdopterin-dependent oxidoreductase [Terrimonas ginsenosidimutans]
MKHKIAGAILLTILSLTTSGQTGQGTLTVKGEVGLPLTITTAGLSEFRHAEANMKDREGNMHKYTGVSVLSILDSAKVTLGKQLRGEHLKKYLLVKCADGYQVLFSLAELDPDFGNKTVILADRVDGKPLPEGKGPFRLIIPDDKALARNSYEVIEMIVSFAKD